MIAVASIVTNILSFFQQPEMLAVSFATVALIIALMVLRAWDRRKELDRAQSRLMDRNVELDRYKKELNHVSRETLAAKEANRELRILLARKEEELGSALGRAAAPLPATGKPENAFGVLAESLAIAAERLKAASERMQQATEVRKAALAKLVAANQSLRQALPETGLKPIDHKPAEPPKKSRTIEIVESLAPTTRRTKLSN